MCPQSGSVCWSEYQFLVHLNFYGKETPAVYVQPVDLWIVYGVIEWQARVQNIAEGNYRIKV